MGTLLHPETAEPLRLLARHLVGRQASVADLHVDDPLCSGQHAELRWTGDGWLLRDLGSRNGTWVDGHRLPPGSRLPLTLHMDLAFGNPRRTFRVQDLGVPTAGAVRPDRSLVFARLGLLALPDPQDRQILVQQDADGRWWLDTRDRQRPCRAEELVELNGVPWRVVAPVGLGQTRELHVERTLDEARLIFHVSPDEEQVAIEAILGGVATILPPRSHLYTLLTLARRRLADRAAGCPADEEGWVESQELAEDLKISTNDLNVHIYRSRCQFRDAGVTGAARVVERHTRHSRLRIGVSDLAVIRSEVWPPSLTPSSEG